MDWDKRRSSEGSANDQPCFQMQQVARSPRSLLPLTSSSAIDILVACVGIASLGFSIRREDTLPTLGLMNCSPSLELETTSGEVAAVWRRVGLLKDAQGTCLRVPYMHRYGVPQIRVFRLLLELLKPRNSQRIRRPA